jgi:hypothetical protein
MGSTIDDTTRATAVLADVSSIVRANTGQVITAGEATLRLPAGKRFFGSLPEHLAVSITSVVDAQATDVAYDWSGFQEIEVDPSSGGVVTITYQHAYSADQEAEIAGLVATIAARAYGVPTDTVGITGESTGAYSYSIGASVSSGGYGMLKSERRTARRILGLSSGMGTIRIGRL